jgi:hypothetical protein
VGRAWDDEHDADAEPSQLSAGTEFIEISIESLPILNVLKAELGGTAGAKILITVTDSTARQ